MATFRGKMLLAKVFMKVKKGMSGGKKNAGFEMTPTLMQMMGSFTVLRLTSLMGAANINFTKEELLDLNKKLNKIKKPKNK